MIVLDKICEFGEFYALSWKLKRGGGQKREANFQYCSLNYIWLKVYDKWNKAEFLASLTHSSSYLLCLFVFCISLRKLTELEEEGNKCVCYWNKHFWWEVRLYSCYIFWYGLSFVKMRAESISWVGFELYAFALFGVTYNFPFSLECKGAHPWYWKLRNNIWP